MIALGIDTSSISGSVGLASADGQMHAELNVRAGLTHSERLLPAVRSVLDVARLEPASIDLFAVAAGPGSFTGLRIGMAAAKGLALACGRPLAGFSTLETIAQACAAWTDPGVSAVCVMMDAGRGEVYRGLFRVGADGLESLAPESALNPAEAASGLPERCLVVGDALSSHSGAIRPRLPAGCVVVPRSPFIGATLALRALALAARAGTEALPLLVPNYLRVSDAERNWRG